MNKFSCVLFFVLSFGLLGNVSADINSGLVAYYAFEGNANDSSGNGNHGRANDNVAYTSGKFGSSASFNGVNNYIVVPHSNSLNLTSQLSLSFWFKGGGAQISYFIRKWNSGTDITWQADLATGGIGSGIDFYVSENGTSSDRVYIRQVGQTYQDNQWHHYSATFEAGSSINLYIDSLLVGTIEGNISNVQSIFSNTSNLTIGEYAGQMDEVRIYNRVLSEPEIQELYTGNPSCTAAEAGTVSSNLDIHMPSLNYKSLLGTQNIWADLEYLGKNSEGRHIWGLENYGANQ